MLTIHIVHKLKKYAQSNPKSLLIITQTQVQPWNQTHYYCEKVWMCCKVTLKLLDEFSVTFLKRSIQFQQWDLGDQMGERLQEQREGGAAGVRKPRREISSVGRRWRELPYSWILEVPAPNTGSLWRDGERENLKCWSLSSTHCEFCCFPCWLTGIA